MLSTPTEVLFTTTVAEEAVNRTSFKVESFY